MTAGEGGGDPRVGRFHERRVVPVRKTQRPRALAAAPRGAARLPRAHAAHINRSVSARCTLLLCSAAFCSQTHAWHSTYFAACTLAAPFRFRATLSHTLR